MKVRQIVTYVSEDGAFGGPVAVAVQQVKALRKLGNDAALIAGWDKRGTIDVEGTRLFPSARLLGSRLVGLFSPGLVSNLLRDRNYDVAHIHFGRDFTSLGAGLAVRATGKPYVLQTHGMVMPSESRVLSMMDTLITRPLLAAADTVIVLTDDEKAGIFAVSRGRAKIVQLPNGIEVSQTDASTETQTQGAPRLVFLARLHERKRPKDFVRMCGVLRDRGCQFSAQIFGPDEGELSSVLGEISRLGLNATVSYDGPVKGGSAPTILAGAAAYVLPSVGEVFPMTILESLSVDTPVVATRDLGMAQYLERHGAALLTEPNPTALADAVESILKNSEVREGLRQGGRHAINCEFSIDAVAAQLVDIYGNSMKKAF
jgi:glycosyltransferase involved in cell wall biosynthesis